MTDDLDPLFKALADPTRRRLLQLLGDRPATTGTLCAEFPELTRFAVMKHLNALEEAGLVSTTKEGRERWNRANPEPLRRLRDHGLFSQDGAPLHLDIAIRTPRRRVYEALTRDIAEWWEGGDALDWVLDPVLGGHFKRLGVDGSQDLWAIVSGFHPGRRLSLQGTFGREDASLAHITLQLDDAAGGTRLTVTGHGAGPAGTWKVLLGDRLVDYLERR